jgi:hypothetical protein
MPPDMGIPSPAALARSDRLGADFLIGANFACTAFSELRLDLGVLRVCAPRLVVCEELGGLDVERLGEPFDRGLIRGPAALF